MYPAVLFLHSALRWLVLGLGALVVLRALTGAGAGRPWTPVDERGTRLFTLLLDVQVLLGLILYLGLSPVTQAAFRDMAGAMQASAIRFWVVEHGFGMLAALALAHIGRARLRKTLPESRRHRVALIFLGLAFLLVLASIPWPGLPYGRPLLRTF